jgi:hypothetical protein
MALPSGATPAPESSTFFVFQDVPVYPTLQQPFSWFPPIVRAIKSADQHGLYRRNLRPALSAPRWISAFSEAALLRWRSTFKFTRIHEDSAQALPAVVQLQK